MDDLDAAWMQAPRFPVASVLNGGVFPVRRIFCVGKNYSEHVVEMGDDPKKVPPVFFTKPADAIVESGAAVAYPPRTEDLHYEGELVIAIGRAGADISIEAAVDHIFGYAAGCDLTRRDLQAAAREKGAPWDMAKAFDQSAPMGAITAGGVDASARLVTRVNDAVRQDASIAEMILGPAEIVAELSAFVALAPGDLIFTGTPAGVGPVSPGDEVEVSIEGLEPLSFAIV